MVPAKLATALSDLYINVSFNITTNVTIYIPGWAVAALKKRLFCPGDDASRPRGMES